MTLIRTAAVMLLWLFACAAADTARDGVWLQYRPAVVELRGKIVVIERFGPPGWGETPDKDMRLHLPILQLDVPVNVRGDPKSDTDTETFLNVKEIQLACSQNCDQYRGREVIVRGTLVSAQTAWQFTDVIVLVQSIVQKGS